MTQANKTEAAILKTLAWFDVFDYPLTREEIWRYGLFIDQCEVPLLEKELEKLLAHKVIAQTEIFYHLPGRGELVAERKKRFNYTDQKFKRAMAFAKIFRFLPSIELIALGNLIGPHNLRSGGDIDLLIVAKPGTIWATRFLTVGLVKLFGLRPTSTNSKDTICLSFYATSDALNFENIAEIKYLYFFYWLAFLTPIYDQGRAYEKLMRDNRWITERLPNFFSQIPHHSRTVEPAKCYLLNWLLAPVYLLEGQLRNLQKGILPQELKQLENIDTRVVVSDRMLKFHSNDRRQEFQEKYRTRLRQSNVE
jgi:hypothetical protein